MIQPLFISSALVTLVATEGGKKRWTIRGAIDKVLKAEINESDPWMNLAEFVQRRPGSAGRGARSRRISCREAPPLRV